MKKIRMSLGVQITILALASSIIMGWCFLSSCWWE